MEKLLEEYNEDDIGEDNYEHCEVHLLIIIPFIQLAFIRNIAF